MNQQAIEYIKKSRTSGLSDLEIKEALLGAGWSESDIDEAFVDVDVKNQNTGLPINNQPTMDQLVSNQGRLLSATELFKLGLRRLRERYIMTLKLLALPLLVFLFGSLLIIILGVVSKHVGFDFPKLFAQVMPSSSTVNSVFTTPTPVINFGLVILFIVFLVSGGVFFVISTVALIHLYGKDELLTFKEYLKFGLSNFWSYVWVTGLAGIITFGGLILLIIPGVIFSVWFSLGVYALVLEGYRGRSALLRSKHLVSGKWGSVFWRFLFVMIVSQLILLPFYILAHFSERAGNILAQLVNFLIIYPLSLAYGAILFRNLFQIKTESFVENKKEANKFIVIGVLGVVVLFVLAGFLIFKTFSQFRSAPYMPTLPYVSPSQPLSQTSDTQQNLNSVFELNKKEMGTKIYYSDRLGVGFTYVPNRVGTSFTIEVTEIGNKIYIHGTSEKPEQGQSIEVFVKDPTITLEQAIKDKFLVNYNSSECFVEIQEHVLPNYVFGEISFPPVDGGDPNAPWWQNGDKCPQEYTKTNAIQYFLMNKNAPSKFVFVKVGQDSITSDGTYSTGVSGGFNWDYSLRILK